jgi:hypothetical protein
VLVEKLSRFCDEREFLLVMVDTWKISRISHRSRMGVSSGPYPQNPLGDYGLK